jgi:hypothetical protein
MPISHDPIARFLRIVSEARAQRVLRQLIDQGGVLTQPTPKPP